MGKKSKTSEKIEMEPFIERVQVLFFTERVKEAVAYLFLTYTKLVKHHLKLTRRPSQTIRQLAFGLVKQGKQDPELVYPFVEKVEQIIYSGMPVAREDLIQVYEMFGKLYLALTSKPLSVPLHV